MLIPDEHITVSSEMIPKTAKKYSRLREDEESWCAKKKPKEQNIRIDFGRFVSLSGVATQGSPITENKATKYKLRYGYDNETWHGYRSNTNLQVRIPINLFVFNSTQARILCCS